MLAGSLFIATAASAAVVGIEIESFPASETPGPAAPITVDAMVYRIVAVADTATTRVLLAGDAAITSTASFYQDPIGSDISPSSGQFPAFPNLAADTFVTLGNAGPAEDVWADTATSVVAFAMGDDFINGTWFNADPPNGLGDAGNYTGFRVPIAQITVLNPFSGFPLAGELTIGWQESGGEPFYITVQISAPTPAIGLDIKPGSCPNSFNRNSNGVLPVALVGTDTFDVSLVDIDSLEIARADGIGGSAAPNEGPPGPHTVVEDVTAPFVGETCECDELAADGIMDLSMKFWSNDVVEALELDDLPAGEFVELELSGTLLDGTEFAARDCIRLVPPGDMNGDGMVGALDLLGMLGMWGPCAAPPAECLADINDDDNVDVPDLLALLANWGSHY